VAQKHIAIIGAGPGGLSSAIILANRGFKVSLYEKESEAGGRNAPIKIGDYTFDTGPTFLMMPFVLEEIFLLAGKKLEDYLNITRLDPMYRLVFDDKIILPSDNKQTMKNTIKNIFPGNENGYEKFLKRERNKFEKMYPCLKIDYSSFFKLFHPNLLKALPVMDLGKTLYKNLARYFSDEKLILSFTFQSKYLGMSAWECPAAFTMIPYVEHHFGVYHVQGGLHKISSAMQKILEEKGGQIYFNTKVKSLLIEGKKAKGIELENGEKIYADEVIINADFAHAASNLFPEGFLKKYSNKNLKKKKYSCSTFMMYLAVDKKYNIPHHNIFFAKDYKTNIENIFNTGKLTDEMSFYIQNASITDPTLAPEGCSSVYILVPVPNNSFGIDWSEKKNMYREKVLNELEKRTELKDIRQHIKAEKIITPADWQSDYSVYYGATFNLGHNLGQMLFFRPHNKFEEVANVYLTGGGTHPGSGLPTIYESGRIASNMISKKYGVKYEDVDVIKNSGI